jgi:hypothetical protein
MSAHHDLLSEAQSEDVERFYREMGSEASSSDPIANSITEQVKVAMDKLHPFLESVKGKPVAVVTV